MLQKFQTPQMILKIMIAMLIAILALWYILGWSDRSLKQISMDEYKIVSATGDYLLHIDHLVVDDALFLDGWCIKPETNYTSVQCRVVLQGTKSKEAFIVPTVMKERADVTQNMDDGFNYDNSGFSVNIPINLLNLETESYHVFILLEVNEKPVLIDANQSVSAVEGT